MHKAVLGWSLVGCLVLGTAWAKPPAAAPVRVKLPRTRDVLTHVAATFVGEPTRAELLLGGLTALARLCPGATAKMTHDTTVSFTVRGKTLVTETDTMVVDSQVAQVLEKAVAMAAPRQDALTVDDAVAAGLVSGTMDRHSAYLRPMFMARLGYSSGEKLGDPGIEPGLSGERVVVKSLAPGSSAALAGLKTMMLIRRLDGVNVDGLSLGEVGALLYGPAGSEVEVVVEARGDKGQPQALTLRRDPPFSLEPHVVLLNGVLHVVPGPLLGNANAVIRKHLEEHRGKLRGVILDFRGNGGGRVGDAAEIADLFVSAGPLCSVVSRPGKPVQRFEAKAGDPGEDLPVVVLVDGRSASAAELVSLVLRERRQTRLVGTQTFGKGSVQQLIKIEGGGYLKVTAAMYMTPAGTTVGEGLLPDVELQEADFPARGKEGVLETDAWLLAAFNDVTRPALDAGPAAK